MSLAFSPRHRSVPARVMPVLGELAGRARIPATCNALDDAHRLAVAGESLHGVVVSERWLPNACAPRWPKLDRKALEQTGRVAIRLGKSPASTRFPNILADIRGH